MSGDTLDFLQGTKETLTGTLHDPAATTGHVLTVQADKSIAAAAGGGGGAGGVTIHSLALNFDTPGLADGITAYVPAVGDLLLDAWVAVQTSFDGTNAYADLSQFTSDEAPAGLFGAGTTAGALYLQSNIDTLSPGGGPAGGINTSPQYPLSLASVIAAATGGSYAGFATALAHRRLTPRRFESTDPLLWVVSQEGTQGGTPIDALVGAAIGYVVVCSPVAA